MAHILIVEDEKSINDLIAMNLTLVVIPVIRYMKAMRQMGRLV
ncbi:MAG: hypothetical protein K0R31_2061 [Clostridiales bacterium]|jgi:DNA-binding response OmpR family regulator|nr:hypothetical protein [Clostridiales bacterium]